MKKLRVRGQMGLVLGLMVVMILVSLVITHFVGRSGAAEPVAAPVVSTFQMAEKAPAPSRSVTLSFAGDCTFGRDRSFDYDTSFDAVYDANGPEYFLKNVRALFAADDLTVVNFEGTLTESQDRADKEWAFKGPKEYAEILTAGSVEAANLANNHSSDYGEESLSDTKANLDAVGISHFGFEETALLDVKGVKVGLLGLYAVYEDPAHRTRLEQEISDLKQQGAEVIVACFHWGLELDYAPEADQVELAHAAIDAGAHLVIGHHPHVVQGIELYKGRYIVYSLGNFCFGGNPNPPDFDAMIVQQTFTLEGDAVETEDSLRVVPCSISSASDHNNYQPTPAEGEEQARIREKLQGLSSALGTKLPES